MNWEATIQHLRNEATRRINGKADHDYTASVILNTLAQALEYGKTTPIEKGPLEYPQTMYKIAAVLDGLPKKPVRSDWFAALHESVKDALGRIYQDGYNRGFEDGNSSEKEILITLEDVLEYLYMAVSSKGQQITEEEWQNADKAKKNGYLLLTKLRKT